MVAVRIIPRDTQPKATMTEAKQTEWKAALAGEPAAEKRCARCKQLRPRNAFYTDKSRKDGLQGYCKDCTSPRRGVAAASITAPVHTCSDCGKSAPAVKFRRYPSGLVSAVCTTCISAKRTAAYYKNRAVQADLPRSPAQATAEPPADEPLIFRAYLLPLPEPRPRATPQRRALRCCLRRVLRAALAEWRR